MEQARAGVDLPAISLPKGGGAVQGIGETFQANSFTGTGNFSVPVFTSPGRQGFSPNLSLQYSTGNGNGIFGLGWNLSIPRITRKTEKGLPGYDDQDVFIMSGAEDLVPKLKDDDPGARDSQILPGDDPGSPVAYRVTRYLPRTEGLFARIQSWEELDPDNGAVKDIFWRVTTKENITSIYGRTRGARIVDPDDPGRIFEWLLEESFDSKGNHISYQYASDGTASGIGGLHEQNRVYAQVYPRRILYGNLPAQLTDFNGNTFAAGVEKAGTHHRDPFATMSRRYAYEVVFDYGDWRHPQNSGGGFVYKRAVAQEELGNTVPVRHDPFSSFRPGFELRTSRRCTNVLMLHHFKELGGPTLVKSTDFSYAESSATKVSLLAGVTVTGYAKRASGDYAFQSMPPVEFGYSEFAPGKQRYRSVSAGDGHIPAQSLNDPNTTLVDAFGNGLPDIVQSAPGGFRCWRNQGQARLDRPHPFHASPAGLSLADPGVSFGDMGGDGLADLVVDRGPVRGFFELQPEHETGGRRTAGWTPGSFRHYDDQPAIDPDDGNLRMLDLTGDGLTDLLLCTDRYFLWYRGKGEQGFEQQQAVPKRHGLENVFFNDPSGRVRLADMSGDGLQDIVLLHNGRVDYWPNLGYGRFGKRLTMSGNTRLPANFDPKRLFLADLDGSGTVDLVYVDFNQVHFWFNQSGNGWSGKQTIRGTPVTIDGTSLTFTDFFGTGTTCLLWSYDYGTFADGNYKVLDFCGGKKPYLLTSMDNNLGATTRVRYAASTKFYLEDLARGELWATALPFPVHVVEKSETIDHVSKTKLVTCYRYHHGYYDGREREFRGFGRVDRIDTESPEEFQRKDLHDEAGFHNAAGEFYVPPVETRTWFHTGAYLEENLLDEHYRSEYWSGDPAAFPLADHELDLSDTAVAARVEAQRALRGSMLRSEVFALDRTDKATRPYSVTENRYKVIQKQPRGANTHGVFLAVQRDAVNYHYERQAGDPRIQHELVMAVDGFGNPGQTAAIAYARRQMAHAEQAKDMVSVVTHDYVDPVDTVANFRHSSVAASVRYELTGLTRLPAEGYSVSRLETGFTSAQDIGYEEQPAPGAIQKRKLKHRITLFWKDDLSGPAPIGETGSHGLVYETYRLALTPGLRQNLFGGRLTHAMGNEGGYRRKSGNTWIQADAGDWWLPSGIRVFDPLQFFLPTTNIDPFQNETFIEYDPYRLFPSRMTDPLDNVQEALTDYRILQPFLVRDINGNHNEIAFNILGLVTGTAIMGKAGRGPGQSLLDLGSNSLAQMRANTDADSLQGLDFELTDTQSRALMADPDGGGQPAYSANNIRIVLGKATTRTLYDLSRFQLDAQPATVCVVSREVHDNTSLAASPLQLTYSYSDGFGREIQKKAQAEPDSMGERRWVASGWTIFNNKGKPVQQYEPFFSDSQSYEADNQVGVSAVLFYDPLQRVVCTLHPNRTYEKTVFDAWRQISWDANDTVLLEPQNDPDIKACTANYMANQGNPGTWYRQRISTAGGPPSSPTPEQQAALKAAEHAGTPTATDLNPQGKVFLTVADNGTESLVTRIKLDIEGQDLSFTDPRGIHTFTHGFDMAGRKLRIDSRDAGDKRLLPAADDRPLYHWDANGHRVRTTFDELRRPLETFVRNAAGTSFLAEALIYGEVRPQAESTNSRGAVWKHFDPAGLVVPEKIDAKNNVLEVQRKLLTDGAMTEVRWPLDPAGHLDQLAAMSLLQSVNRLGTAGYSATTSYDALNRVTRQRLPDGTLQMPVYNRASLLDSVVVQHPGRTAEPYIKNIDYNARGQRTKLEYGNGVVTAYYYERETFRLKRIDSTRKSRAPKRLQELAYTYDPVGNITSIRDGAHAKIFNRNQAIDAESRYTYDPVYRLVEATGREHESLTSCHYQVNGRKHTEFLSVPQTSANAQALINYLEKYQYDESGNIERIEHSNTVRTTIREQTFATQGNRIRTTMAGCPRENRTIPHDAAGNIKELPHLPELVWDYRNQLAEVQLNASGNPDKVYYQYDSEGRRIRKTIVKNNGNRVEERIYLGCYELYTERSVSAVQGRRDTIHVKDDHDRIALIDLQRDVANPAIVVTKTTRYQLGNHIGSSQLELDETARWISYEEYYPYGGTSYMSGLSRVETSLKRYRYTGKERDDETGMYYYGARYYAPWLGRWISCDPIGIAGGDNLYQFVANEPLTIVDEDGRAPIHEAESNVVRTGVQLPGYNKMGQGPLTDEFTGRWTTRSFFEAHPGVRGYHGDVITQFDTETRYFKGTGDTRANIWSKGRFAGQGIPERLRVEHFGEFSREFGRPRGFDLQVVESRTVQAMTQGDEFVKTRIGRHVTDVARARGLVVKNVEHMIVGEGVVFVRGEFARAFRVSGGGLLGAASLLEVPVMFGWLALTDDPDRIGHIGREPIIHIYTEAKELQELQQMARLDGFESHADYEAQLATNLGCTDCVSYDVRGAQPRRRIDTNNTRRFLQQYYLENPGPKHPTISNPPDR